MDSLLEGLWAQRLGSWPVKCVRPVLYKPGGYDEVLQSVETPATFDPGLAAVIDRACAPADPLMVTRELSRLKAGTVGRAMDGIDIEMWLVVLGEEIEEFPPDVIRAACRKWLRREKWTPSVADLVEECNRLVGWRWMMRNAMRNRERLDGTAA